MNPSIFITIPTYRERENISALVQEILSLDPQYQIVIIDDFSNDGTKEDLLPLIQSTGRIHLLLRRGIRGRGLAGRDGFLYALEKGAQRVVEMDGDFSHRPQDIPALVEATSQADIAVGSRFVPGAGLKRESLLRNLISSFSIWLIRKVTGVPLQDPTSGFRCYRREALLFLLEKAPLLSKGPSIVEEVEYKAHLMGFTFQEVPIVFMDRKKGKSTFNARIAFQVLFFLFSMPFLFGHLKGLQESSLEKYSPQERKEIQ